jgi:hypothetical protein
MRIKGVFHTERGWLAGQADCDGVRWQPVAWRTDSRLEVIASPTLDTDAIEAALAAAVLDR